jgi:hypothetical protein
VDPDDAPEFATRPSSRSLAVECPLIETGVGGGMTVSDRTVEEVTDRDPEMADELSLMGPKDSSLKRWVLLEANRLALAGGLLVVVFLVLLVAHVAWPFEMKELLMETTATQTLFNTLLRGTILVVTVVVSINSIVLSQDLTSLRTQQKRVDGAMEFQERVEEVVGVDTCPTEPAAFLQLMLESVLERAADVGKLHDKRPEGEAHAELESYLYFLEGYTNVVADRMHEADAGSIEVLIVGLTYDYAGAMHAARTLLGEYGEGLTTEEREALEHLVETLRLFSVGHEYFKSLFYMHEFGKLSKSLLYVALPVIVMISYVLLAISGGQYPVSTLPFVDTVTVFMMAVYSVALAPYVVLTAFVLRSATIASRSLASGPFVLSRNH